MVKSDHYIPKHRGYPSPSNGVDILNNGEYRDIPVQYEPRHKLEKTKKRLGKAAVSQPSITSPIVQL